MATLDDGQKSYQQRHQGRTRPDPAGLADKVTYDADGNPSSSSRTGLQRGRDQFAARSAQGQRGRFNF